MWNLLNPFEHSICFTQPLRIAPSVWTEHIPFAMFLVDILRPKVIVELGTYTGVSYCAFCQAVKTLGLDTRCYAVDTWKGDEHAGFYGPEVLEDLRKHHDPLYGGFSRLISTTFDEALNHFEDNSIDLLHIDGYHTYEAVKHDFESWLPKVSSNGMILFHDINVREHDFGVWKLWVELKEKYRTFEFIHAHGLGVLAKGKSYPKEVEAFLDLSGEAAVKFREFFYRLGFSVALQNNDVTERTRQFTDREGHIQSLIAHLAERDSQVQTLSIQLAERDSQIQTLSTQLAEREKTISNIYNSHGWKALLVYYRLRDRFLPISSKRRKAAKFVWNIFFKKRLKRAFNIFRNEERTFDQLPKKIKTDSNIQTEKSIEAVIENLDTALEKNIRIAFVGQPEYFRFTYEDLDRVYNIKEFVLKWGADIQYYKGLIEFNPHVAFFFRPELYPDALLETLKGIRVGLSSEPIPKYYNNFLVTSEDMELRFNSLKSAKKKKYDYFYHYDKTSLKFLKENGFKVDGEFIFPVATGIYRPIDCEKKWDWGFFGRSTEHREKFLGVAKRDFNGLHIAHGIYGEEYVQLLNACKIGINLHIDKNISFEPRLQMMMACKVMVMSEPLSHNDLFKSGIHYVEFREPEEFWEKLRYYIKNQEEREKIALNGFRLVRECLSSRVVFRKLITYLIDHNKQSLLKSEAELDNNYRKKTIFNSKGNESNDCNQTRNSNKLVHSKNYLKLDLGCGKFKRSEFIGVDIEKFDCVDIIADLNQPLPFKDNSVGQIYCSHTLEHIRDPHHLIDEIYRVCIPDAVVEYIMPLNESNPTHITIFDEGWFANNLRRERFTIISNKVQTKAGISPTGKKHSWIEQKVVLRVLKENPKTDTFCLIPSGSSKELTNILSPKRVSKKEDNIAKPSIAFIIPSQNISGGTMVICQHANRLIRKGYNVILVNNNLNDQFKLDWFPNLLADVIPINKLDQNIDIAIATHWSTAYRVREFLSRRKLYFVQSDETRFNPPGSEEREMARKTYTFDFEFIVIARWLQKWLKNNFNKSAYYVPNGLDPLIFYPDKPLTPKSDKLRVLLEGPIDVPFKGMEDAFQVVEGMDCEVWCVSTFGRPKPNWKCDRFFEKVPLEKMRNIYSSCDVLIKMSKVEGFFMPPLEMMACGGTVITGKVTGYDEYIVDGYNALVVEQGDVESAREKLRLLINDRDLLNRLIKGGLETVKNWTWEYSNDQLEKIIKGELRLNKQ